MAFAPWRAERTMTEPTLRNHVMILERKVEGLSSLPARVAAVEMQIVQLREEMRGGFSAIRGEMAALGDTLRVDFRGELHKTADALRIEIREGDEETRRLMREGDEETRRYMRVLHEEVIARIATISERRAGKKR
jgi:hypothetical protein